ncbi:MAG: helix-turn-helix transcriptional regulator [Thermomicrobiales bacterium]|nr:helix-turn-helix transcriptional regulator [Thermomicrobiales bacterium]
MASAKARKYQELREARGLSPDEAARRLAVDADEIRAWERGEREPDAATEQRLAEVYGVSQDELRHAENARHHPDGKRS